MILVDSTVLVCAAIANSAILLSADNGFSRVNGLHHVVPDDRRVETLLQS